MALRLPALSEKIKAEESYERRPVLIYGDPKIGKTSFCAQVPGILFLATERGLNDVSGVNAVYPKNWEELRGYVDLLVAGAHEYQAVAIDTIDNAYLWCTDFVMRNSRTQFVHPSDLEYGKGWDMITSEFRRLFAQLSNLPLGVWLISHASTVQEQSRTETYSKKVPSFAGISSKAFRAITGWVDAVLYFGYRRGVAPPGGLAPEERAIHLRPSNYWIAGVRDPRLLPETIPLDGKAYETFQNLMRKDTKL
jgi:hypothetical protein